MDFGKIYEKIQRRKKYSFQQMVAEHLDIHMKKINPRLNIILYTQIKSKWMIDLNIKQKTMNI